MTKGRSLGDWLGTAVSRHTRRSLDPRTRRVVQAVLYEGIAVAVIGPALGCVFDEPIESSVGLAVFMSTVALAWNFVFNGWFERWEASQPVRSRSWPRRMAHGLGFEGGLVVMLVPVMAWWLNTSLVHAFVADLGILAFFFAYAVGFTWAFDRVFGLPRSAGPAFAVQACFAVDAAGEVEALDPGRARQGSGEPGARSSAPARGR